MSSNKGIKGTLGARAGHSALILGGLTVLAMVLPSPVRGCTNAKIQRINTFGFGFWSRFLQKIQNRMKLLKRLTSGPPRWACPISSIFVPFSFSLRFFSPFSSVWQMGDLVLERSFYRSIVCPFLLANRWSCSVCGSSSIIIINKYVSR